ncbi:hypothetical protein [Halomonas salipaludis]|uniref:Uncharacterized protein n=1 Tax=Halomonas salipaludis TaxID=2032625 RepID=A0A2A2ESP7_9GAMM|nr:hypothetical protein [Halomonas salipaludis]PAU76146.1 hypothetical protein CK498_14745 [Halomonas salipaludis]
MGAPDASCDLPAEPLSTAYPMVDTTHLAIDANLVRRLAKAKARLDRLEQQTRSRDDTALAAARIEFSLASRALADALITQDAHLAVDT